MLEGIILNKRLFIFFLISQLHNISLCSQNMLNDSIIIWSKDYRLKVDDFKRKTEINSKDKNNFVEGLCNYSIQYVYHDTINIVNIQTLFNTKGSYLSSFNNIDYVLQHEQLHFDIGELYARKFRKWLLNYYFEESVIDYSTIDIKLNEILIQLNIFQSEYDNEEYLILNNENQKKWQEKIKKELELLEPYSYENYLKTIEEIK
jgi:hypothetical protein